MELPTPDIFEAFVLGNFVGMTIIMSIFCLRYYLEDRALKRILDNISSHVVGQSYKAKQNEQD